MEDMKKIKGFQELDPLHQELFKRVHQKHLDAVENKQPWTPKSVKWDDRERCLIVKFINKDWLHYTVGGDWF